MKQNYPACYVAVRKYEGGNDDDPRDPGGRTSRGIIQREWDKFRATHPGRPADVWKASEDDIATIYKGDYWDKQALDAIASGVDETLFDYGVNSGIGRSAKVLRRCLHMADNASAGDVRIRLLALSQDQIRTLIAAINDERLAFLKSLKTWPIFGGGWGKRVAGVKALSISLFAAGGTTMPTTPSPSMVPDAAPVPGKGQHEEPTTVKNVIKASVPAGGTVGGATWLDWIAAHPWETASIAVAGIVAAVLMIGAINRWHKNRNEAPVPGWMPPAELKPV